MKIFIFIIFISFFASCSVQQNAEAVAVENVSSSSANQFNQEIDLPYSPFEIKKLLASADKLDISQFWIRTELGANGFDVVIDENLDVNSAALIKNEPEGAVLRFWSPLTEDARFVLLQQQKKFDDPKDQWKFVGYVDAQNQKYAAPEYRVINGADKNWLIVKELTGRGTGVSTYEDFWHEIKKAKLNSALNYVSKGNDFNGNVWDREFRANILDYSDKRIEIGFEVDWINWTEDEKPEKEIVFSQHKKAVYDWDETKRQFVFDESKSEISLEEIQNVYNFDSLDDDEYLKYTYANLEQIAKNGDENHKKWLAGILEKLSNSKQKQALEQYLKQ